MGAQRRLLGTSIVSATVRRALAVGFMLAVAAGGAAMTAAEAPAGATRGYTIIRTVAGNGEEDSSGDGGPATEASLAGPADVVADRAGNFYVAELFGNRVRKVGASGTITTLAGDGTAPERDPSGTAPDVGDGGPATEAQLNVPTGVAVDGAGNVYIADSENQRIRRVDREGTIRTVAGTGEFGYGGDGGPATEAQLGSPQAVAVDGSGSLYIADTSNGRIRKVDSSGIITTVAGTGDFPDGGDGGDGGPATEAQVGFPLDLDVGSDGSFFIVEQGRVRKVDGSGIITTVAGTGEFPDGGGDGDGGPATDAALDPQGVSLDRSDLYIADSGGGDGRNGRVRKVDAAGTITTVAGGGNPKDGLGDGGPPKQARLAYPDGLDVDEELGLLIADLFNERVRQVIAVPDLLAVIKSDSPDPLNIDEELTYKIEVTNNGTEPATGVTLSDPLPPKVRYGSAEASGGSCTRADRTVTCALGELAAGDTATVTVTVIPTRPGLITNTATVGADGPDPFPGNDSASAETSVGDRGCGQVITHTTRLREDIGPCPATGAVIGANNITFDLRGHRIFGFPGRGDGNSAGIRLTERRRVRITGGTVSRFDAGVVLNRGQHNEVSEMTVRRNRGPDDAFNAELGDGIILFDSALNRIVDNHVTRNGIFDGIGVLGGDADGNVLEGNTVSHTVGPSDEGPAGQGIIVNAFLGELDGETIDGSEIRRNVIRGSASAGSANINNINARILGNVIKDNGLTNMAGNGIGLQLGPRADLPFTRALVKRNSVEGNGQDGIQVQRGATENRIIDNDAADNNALAESCDGGDDPACQFRGFDLHDLNRDPDTFEPDCDSNVWRRNVWGSGFYSPKCVATGGSGPPFPEGPEGPSGDRTCSDGLDNDQDGLPDFEDPGCQPTEGPDAGEGSCSDGLDNDGDDLIDGDDPDCQEAGIFETGRASRKPGSKQLPPTRQAPPTSRG